MTERSSRRWSVLRLFALILSLALLTAACGGGDDDEETGGGTETGSTEEEGGQPKKGGQITVGLEAETNNWLPGKYAGANAGDMVRNALFDRLVRRDDKGELKPYLAESLTPNEALTEWTLKLRPNVKFHDGADLNAEAIKYNWDKLLTAPGSNTIGTINGTYKVQKLDVVDPLTVKYTIAEANNAFPDLLAGTVGMPFSPKAHQEKGDAAGDAPVGTGPFKFVSWQRDAQLVVERFDGYWYKDKNGSGPWLDRITFRPIPDEDTRLQSLLSGDVQVMHSLRQSIVKQASENDEITSHNFLGNNGGGAIFNTQKAPVDDKRVRKALTHAINQEEMVEVLGGVEIAGIRTQYWAEDSKWHSNKVKNAWPKFDAKKAKDMLATYMNDPARSDKKPAGSPVSVEFNCPPDPSLQELAQLYQKYWTDIGVQVKLNTVEQAAHIQNGIRNEYMINCWRQGGESDPYTEIANAFGPLENILNFTNFQSDVTKRVIDVLRTEKDEAKRKAAIEELGLHFADEVPNLWTGGTPNVVGTSKNVRGINGWKFPDGSAGGGQISSIVVSWSHVWVS